jgi:hypothetical protein
MAKVYATPKHRIRIDPPAGSKPHLPSESQLADAERVLRFRFPPSYRRFLLAVGAGSLGGYFDLLAPEAPVGYYDLIATGQDQRVLLEDRFGDDRANRKRIKGFIPFALTPNHDVFCWSRDDVAQAAAPAELPVHLVAGEREEITRVAGSFEELLDEVWLGGRFGELAAFKDPFRCEAVYRQAETRPLPPPEPPVDPAANRLPVLPLRDLLPVPSIVFPLDVARPRSVQALRDAMKLKHGWIALLAQRDPATTEPAPDMLYPTGSLARVVQMAELPTGGVRAVLEACEALTATGWPGDVEGSAALWVEYDAVPEEPLYSTETARFHARLVAALPGDADEALRAEAGTMPVRQLESLLITLRGWSIAERVEYLREPKQYERVRRLLGESSAGR